MPEYPKCPFCEHRLTESVPQSIEGSIKLRCPSCEQRYEYIAEAGSFPLDDDHDIKVTKGVLGSRMTTGTTDAESDISLSRALLIGGLCCCTIAVLIPVVLSLLFALFG
jgi:transcription elongation factor Elf1